MRCLILLLIPLLCLGCSKSTGPGADVTQLLGQLKNPDAEVRLGAIRELQTSLDPRVPEACLPLLDLEGNSVRRLAARAIGSRWQAIPKDRIPAYTAALKAQLGSEHEGLVNMARRGIALLNRDYTNTMVSPSANKRWVIYERYGLPCLIDTRDESEEILGYGSNVSFSPAWGNTEVAPAAIWHPSEERVALGILENRKLSSVWIWVHGKGLHPITEEEVVKCLGRKMEDIVGAMGFYTEITGWKGDVLEFSLSYSVLKGEEPIDYEAVLQWDTSTDTLKLLSNKTAPQ